jgi:hypothetical protein
MDVAPEGTRAGGAFEEGGDGVVRAQHGVGEVPRLAGGSGRCDLGELEMRQPPVTRGRGSDDRSSRQRMPEPYRRVPRFDTDEAQGLCGREGEEHIVDVPDLLQLPQRYRRLQGA